MDDGMPGALPQGLLGWSGGKGPDVGRRAPDRDGELAALARRLYEQRRARDLAFGAEAEEFGEPAWDLLLDLFHAEWAGSDVSLSSACIASCSPTSTAMRHVRSMERRGILARSRDPNDARRWFLRLTPRGRSAMRAILSSCGSL